MKNSISGNLTEQASNVTWFASQFSSQIIEVVLNVE